MYRRILLDKPLKYKALNGDINHYNCILIYFSDDNNLQMKLSEQAGCALHKEVVITTDIKGIPEGYVALRPTIPAATIFPELIKRQILIAHPTNKAIHNCFIDHPLYSIQLPKQTVKTLLSKQATG